MTTHLHNLIETLHLPPSEITARTCRIYETVLQESRYLDAGNFTAIHPADLECLFEQYDRTFLDGWCRKTLAGRTLSFRFSKRMTRAGGKTLRYQRRNGTPAEFYEIAISSTLLFQTFHDVDRPITVTGIVCRDRLEALQRIFEHELVHLVEMLVWTKSNCAAGRFQSMAARCFGHTEHTHQLVTPGERAQVKFGIRPGSRVRFRFEGQEHVGIVNRITKRATILVEDSRGPRYSDGRRYAKFYIPVALLEPVEAS